MKIKPIITFSALALCSSLFPLSASGKQAEGSEVFKTKVWPIMKESCVSCHGPNYVKKGRKKRAKAGLRLDNKKDFIFGSDDGPVIVAGNPEKSSLYTLTTLGENHDDIMPPKGKILSKAQQKTLKDWIQSGADFGSWTKANDDELKKIFPEGFTR